jgi:hypothetical protein
MVSKKFSGESTHLKVYFLGYINHSYFKVYIWNPNIRITCGLFLLSAFSLGFLSFGFVIWQA